VVNERAYGKIAGPNPGAPGPKKEILVYGRAPEGASAVRVTADEGVRIEAAL
jgi:hypothetical protein